MTLEEIKQELLKDDGSQRDITISSTFLAICNQLIKKEVFTLDDIDEINKTTEEYVEYFNKQIAEKALEKLEQENT